MKIGDWDFQEVGTVLNQKAGSPYSSKSYRKSSVTRKARKSKTFSQRTFFTRLADSLQTIQLVVEERRRIVTLGLVLGFTLTILFHGISYLLQDKGVPLSTALLPDTESMVIPPKGSTFTVDATHRARLVSDVNKVLTSIQGLSAERRGPLATAIVNESIGGNFDPLFIAAVIRYESAFNRNAISPKGARGLMQLMPSTGQFISASEDISWKGTHALHDANYNLRLGIAYLNHLADTFKGDWKRVLIAYNWGPGNLSQALKTSGSRIPSSSVKYANAILKTHQSWRRATPKANPLKVAQNRQSKVAQS